MAAAKKKTEAELLTTQILKDNAVESEAQETQTLEEAFASLDEIIETLEDRETSLEASFQAYQRGMILLKECSQKIDRVEKKVMVMNEDGELDEFR